MQTKFDVPGFPDGTTTTPVPATCPDPGTYVVPSCAHESHIIHIPLDMGLLPVTGAEVLWWVVPVAWLAVGVGVALLLGAFIRSGRRGDDL